jgi:type I restriction enzyme S subunit
MPVTCASFARFLRVDPNLAEPEFVFWFLQALYASGAIEKHQVQHSGIARFQYTKFASEVEILMPPRSEQLDIARTMGALDDKIALLRETNATLEAIAQALFKSWFVDFDPVRAKAEGRDPEGVPPEVADLFPSEFEDSELGTIPKGWRVGSIYEVASVVYGAPFASKPFNSERRGYPLIRIRDLQSQNPDVFTEEVHPKGTLIKPGALLVGMDGEFKPVIWAGPISWLNQRVCMFEPRRGASAEFVRGSILPHLEFFERAKVGTTVIHLGKGDIDNFLVVIPPKNVLDSYSQVVESTTELRLNNAVQMATLTDLRDTLLPRLMSGKLRIPDVEEVLA